MQQPDTSRLFRELATALDQAESRRDATETNAHESEPTSSGDALHEALFPKPFSSRQLARMLTVQDGINSSKVLELSSQLGTMAELSYATAKSKAVLRSGVPDLARLKSAALCAVVSSEASAFTGEHELACELSSLAVKILDLIDGSANSTRKQSFACAAMQPFLGAFFRACALDSGVSDDIPSVISTGHSSMSAVVTLTRLFGKTLSTQGSNAEEVATLEAHGKPKGASALLWGPRIAVLVAALEWEADEILRRDAEEELEDELEGTAHDLNDIRDPTSAASEGARSREINSKVTAQEDATTALLLYRAASLLRSEFRLGQREMRESHGEADSIAAELMEGKRGSTRVGLRAVMGMLQAGEARCRSAQQEWQSKAASTSRLPGSDGSTDHTVTATGHSSRPAGIQHATGTHVRGQTTTFLPRTLRSIWWAGLGGSYQMLRAIRWAAKARGIQLPGAAAEAESSLSEESDVDIAADRDAADRAAEAIAVGKRETCLAVLLLTDLEDCTVQMLLQGVRREASAVLDQELLAQASVIFKSVDSMRVGVATAGHLRRAVRSSSRLTSLCDTAAVLQWLESVGVEAIKASRELRGGWRQQTAETACDLACRWRKRDETTGWYSTAPADELADRIEALDQFGSGGISWDDSAQKLGARAGAVLVDALQEASFKQSWRLVPTDTSAILAYFNSCRLDSEQTRLLGVNDVSVSAWFPDSDAIVWEAFLSALTLGAPEWSLQHARLRSRALAIACASGAGWRSARLQTDGRTQLIASLRLQVGAAGVLSPIANQSLGLALAARAVEYLSQLDRVPADFAAGAAGRTQDWLESQTGQTALEAAVRLDERPQLRGLDGSSSDDEPSTAASGSFQQVNDQRRLVVQKRIELEWALQLDLAVSTVARFGSLGILFIQQARHSVLDSSMATSQSAGATAIRLQRQPALAQRLVRLLNACMHAISRVMRRLLLLQMQVKAVVARTGSAGESDVRFSWTATLGAAPDQPTAAESRSSSFAAAAGSDLQVQRELRAKTERLERMAHAAGCGLDVLVEGVESVALKSGSRGGAAVEVNLASLASLLHNPIGQDGKFVSVPGVPRDARDDEEADATMSLNLPNLLLQTGHPPTIGLLNAKSSSSSTQDRVAMFEPLFASLTTSAAARSGGFETRVLDETLRKAVRQILGAVERQVATLPGVHELVEQRQELNSHRAIDAATGQKEISDDSDGSSGSTSSASAEEPSWLTLLRPLRVDELMQLSQPHDQYADGLYWTQLLLRSGISCSSLGDASATEELSGVAALDYLQAAILSMRLTLPSRLAVVPVREKAASPGTDGKRHAQGTAEQAKTAEESKFALDVEPPIQAQLDDADVDSVGSLKDDEEAYMSGKPADLQASVAIARKAMAARVTHDSSLPGHVVRVVAPVAQGASGGSQPVLSQRPRPLSLGSAASRQPAEDQSRHLRHLPSVMPKSFIMPTSTKAGTHSKTIRLPLSKWLMPRKVLPSSVSSGNLFEQHSKQISRGSSAIDRVLSLRLRQVQVFLEQSEARAQWSSSGLTLLHATKTCRQLIDLTYLCLSQLKRVLESSGTDSDAPAVGSRRKELKGAMELLRGAAALILRIARCTAAMACSVGGIPIGGGTEVPMRCPAAWRGLCRLHGASPEAAASVVALRCAAVAAVRGLQLSLACGQVESSGILDPRGSTAIETRKSLMDYAEFFVDTMPDSCRTLSTTYSEDEPMQQSMSRAGVLHVVVASECFALTHAGAAEDIEDVVQQAHVDFVEQKTKAEKVSSRAGIRKAWREQHQTLGEARLGRHKETAPSIPRLLSHELDRAGSGLDLCMRYLSERLVDEDQPSTGDSPNA